MRSSLVLAEVSRQQPDVLLLQELDAVHYPSMSTALGQAGYDGDYVQRTGGRGDGCATFW